jgi:2,4-dienoyl-CoA reductase-like NADH-dependent reductase (Old Yellow Enzyme family)
MTSRYPPIGSLRSVAEFRDRLASIGCDLPCDEPLAPPGRSPLSEPFDLSRGAGRPLVASNRFVIQPMEGWDGELDGRPSALTLRRWRNFGRSGAGWIWGGEAVAVSPDGRANPRQLLMDSETASSIGELRAELLAEARNANGGDEAPIVGLQLTHSGRWSRSADGAPAPRVAFRHPLLDARSGVRGDDSTLSDFEVERIVEAFARAARLAREEGFDFVDIKHCHGYLLHEFLAARVRPGPWGGPTLDDRSRLLRAILAAVREAAPRLAIAIRLSAFDLIPPQSNLPGDCGLPYEFGFGVDPRDPTEIDLSEPIELARRLPALGVRWLNVTGASPYYSPHAQRPAYFPPSDGYAPPEDPLLGVARLLGAARAIKSAVPELTVVSSGWSYLQEFIARVAEACLREGWFDAVGLGRMALAYPELPRDLLAGRAPDRRRLCRTFSDCTTAPRNGMVSGCYPLDPFYRERPERERLIAIKSRAKGSAA